MPCYSCEEDGNQDQDTHDPPEDLPTAVTAVVPMMVVTVMMLDRRVQRLPLLITWILIVFIRHKITSPITLIIFKLSELKKSFSFTLKIVWQQSYPSSSRAFTKTSYFKIIFYSVLAFRPDHPM